MAMNKKKCIFISPRLECIVGGFGTLHCLTEQHVNCKYRKKQGDINN